MLSKIKGVIQHYNLRKNCQYCHSNNIKIMTQTEFYGREYNGAKMYVCQKCGARAGCHKGTEIPLGCLADDELRKLRKEIHDIIDTMWKTREERTILYKKLSEKYGDKFHVGFLKNEQARWVLYDLQNNP
jgi:hypothetical protein